MSTTREAGQSLASAIALDAYMAAGQVSSDANWEVITLAAQLKKARAAAKIAKAAELAARDAYEATPYSE